MIRHNILYAKFCDWQFPLSKADGSFLWDRNGRKYIDFTSGWNVTNLGWNHPEIAAAMKKQIDRNVYAPMWSNDGIQEEYARELTDSLPSKLDTAVRATGGTDANEKALMIARSVTGRKKIIGFRDTYHGHSYGTISVGYRNEYLTGEAPVVPEFIKMDFPQTSGDKQTDREIMAEFLTELETILKNRDVAAIMTEAGVVTGWGTMNVAPDGYLKGIRKLTEAYGTLLILDEVGTGFSRVGNLFAMERERVVPDVVTFAKGMTNGAAAAATCVVRSELGEKPLENAKTHSTFGWTSVGCAAALATLRIHKREKIWEVAGRNGPMMIDRLKTKLEGNGKIGRVQGIGMEIGVTFEKKRASGMPDDKTALAVIAACHAKGLHLIFGGDGTIQIMPPLTTHERVLNDGVDIFLQAIESETV